MKRWFFCGRCPLSGGNDCDDHNHHQQERNGSGCNSLPGVWITRNHKAVMMLPSRASVPGRAAAPTANSHAFGAPTYRLNRLAQILNALRSALHCTLSRARSARCDRFFAALTQSTLESVPTAANAFRITADYHGIRTRRDDPIGRSRSSFQIGSLT